MRKSAIYLLVALAGVAILAGCERVGEPWDKSGYFQEKRTRTSVAEKHLRDRVMHSQNDFEFTTHQTEYQ